MESTGSVVALANKPRRHNEVCASVGSIFAEKQPRCNHPQNSDESPVHVGKDIAGLNIFEVVGFRSTFRLEGSEAMSGIREDQDLFEPWVVL